MKRFYSDQVGQGQALLTGPERDHCVRVLRTAIGEAVEIVDGRGNLWPGSLMASDKKTASIRLTGEPKFFPPSPLPTLLCAIPKNSSRWEWLLEKATEIGVGRIVPIVAKRSEKARIRRDRCEQIILAAFKQSGRYYLPELADPMSFDAITRELHESDVQRFIGYCGDGLRVYLGEAYQPGQPAVVAIGPEGDFTEEEISLAISRGFAPVDLGSTRLRVETAGVAACSIIQCMEQMNV